MKIVVVTDPCYILSQKEWLDLVKNHAGNDDEFSLKVTEKLIEISGDSKAVAGPTKVGDWTNSMTYKDGVCEILDKDFAADSGMVCVVEMTDKLSDYWIKNGSSVADGCVARLIVPSASFYELNFMGEETKVKLWLGDFTLLLAESR